MAVAHEPLGPVIETRSYPVERDQAQRELNIAWWAVVVRFLLHGLIAATWVSRIPAIKTDLALTNAQLGLSLLGTAVGSAIAIPCAGWLVNRFGSRRPTSWSTAAFCLALIAPSFAINATTLFLALMLFGAAAGANDVAMNSQAVAVEVAMRTPTMSRFHAMFSIGAMAGAAIGGIAAGHEIAPRIHLCVAAAVFLLLSAFTAPLLLEAHDGGAKHKTLISLKHIPAVLFALAAIGFCMFLCEGAMADWIGVYLKQVLSSGSGIAAAGYGVFSAGMALFRLLGDTVTKRLGPVRTVRTGAFVAAAGLLFALAAPSATLALPGFALTGAGFSVIVPLVFGAGGRSTSLPRGAGVAFVSGSGYFGFLFGPPIIGLVAQATSLRLALLLVVALTVFAGILADAVRAEGRSPKTSN